MNGGQNLVIQVDGLERLPDKFVYPCFPRFYDHGTFGEIRDHDDWNSEVGNHLGRPPYVPDEFHTVDLQHLVIHQKQIKGAGMHCLKCMPALTTSLTLVIWKPVKAFLISKRKNRLSSTIRILRSDKSKGGTSPLRLLPVAILGVRLVNDLTLLITRLPCFHFILRK